MIRCAKARGAIAPGLLAGLLFTVASAQAEVQEGKPAPDIQLPATGIGKVLPEKKDARTLRLSDLKGRNVVLFFYPKAMTGG